MTGSRSARCATDRQTPRYHEEPPAEARSRRDSEGDRITRKPPLLCVSAPLRGIPFRQTNMLLTEARGTRGSPLFLIRVGEERAIRFLCPYRKTELLQTPPHGGCGYRIPCSAKTLLNGLMDPSVKAIKAPLPCASARSISHGCVGQSRAVPGR